jgi:hypothetical protein
MKEIAFFFIKIDEVKYLDVLVYNVALLSASHGPSRAMVVGYHVGRA